MERNKFAKQFFALALATLPLASCSEDVMDKINKDKNNPTDVAARFVMTDVMSKSAIYAGGGDLSMYASIYMEHEVGIENQTYNAEIRSGEPNVSSTYNNMWEAIYSNIRNAKDVIKKTSPGGKEAGNDVTLGAAKVMYAYNAAVLTDLFGDVPFAEACEFDELGKPLFMQPAIDKQESVHTAIMKLLDEAIVLLDGKDVTAMGKQDLVYGGSSKLWKQAAYGLKARYSMRLLAKSADKTKTMNEALDYISKSFQSAGEEFKFAIYDGNSQLNPLFDFMYSRKGLGASQSLIEKMTARKDPRLNQSFASEWDSKNGKPTIQATDSFNMAPNGKPVQGLMNYNTSLASWGITAPTQFLSYHELLFIKAEILCRMNKKGEAEAALQEAITAGFANAAVSLNSAINGWGIKGKVNLTADVATKYYNESVKTLFAANPLKEVMTEKYLAFFGASGESMEAYNDYRRMKALGENFIELKNEKNASKFPLRFGYGTSDVSANLKVKEAFGDGQYVYSENVWWAGGTR